MKAATRAIALYCAVAVAGCGSTTASRPATTAPTGPVQVDTSQPGVVPVGQELDVRLQTPLSSETSTVEQRFEATTVVDVVQNGRVLIPAGSIVRGVVADVKLAGRDDELRTHAAVGVNA